MRQQKGGTLLGFILGLVVGLSVALVVAVYVTKVPIPFMNKAPSRSAEQDAAEQKKNKDWDPNAPLYGKNPAKPAAPSEPIDAAPPTVEDKKSDDPLGDLARAKAGADPFLYFVQAGAYRSEPEAQAQKAKLALKGLESGISEREQDGRTVFRVRLGPFDTKEDAEVTKKKLDGIKVEAALVRVQR
ncbi:MAG: sporulation protein [Betaproteobacteria bacterium]|nr:sporulation protein [Betaproteobacteria bacterium]NBY04104.1 sporulation protein [Betaproteobacteria bacterium]